jgi:hypothetical protein
MKNFLSDRDGVSQKDFVLLLNSLLVVVDITLPIIFVLIDGFRNGYNVSTYDFILQLIKYITIPYGVIVAFYFLNESSVRILQYLSIKVPISPVQIPTKPQASESNELPLEP